MAEFLSKNLWGFDPRSITGCKLWIDAGDTSSITRSGNNVLTVRNKALYTDVSSSSGIAATTGSLTLNGLNLISIGNDVSLLIPTNITFNGPQRSIFVVAQLDASSVTGSLRQTGFLEGTTAAQSMILRINDINTIQFARSGSNLATVVYNASWASNVFNNSFILSGNNNGPTTNDRGIYINGSSQTLAVDASTVSFGVGATVQTIAGSVTSRAGWRLGEMLLYDERMTSTQRQQIEGYLANRWGLTAKLPIGHPYATLPPFNKIFAPTDISGMILWLDAADLTTVTLSGSNVSQWSDKSSSSNHAVQATASNQPVFVENVQNGLPIMRFSGSNAATSRYFSNTTMAFPNAPYSIFTVSRIPVDSVGLKYLLKVSYNTDYYFFVGATGSNFTTFAGSSIAWNDTSGISGAAPTSNWTSFTAINRGTATGLVPFVDTVASTGKNGATAAGTGYCVGDRETTTLGSNFNGDVGEIIVYNRDICGSEQARVEGYLARKWGSLSKLPATFSYASNRLQPQTIPFEPLFLSNLVLWVDGTDPCGNRTTPADGGAVTTWFDKSGQSNNMTASAGTPTYSVTTRAVKLGGAAALLTSNATAAPFTAFFIYKNYTGSGPIFSTNDVPNVDGFWPNNSWDALNRMLIAVSDGTGFGNWYAVQPTPYPLNRTCMVTVQYDGTAIGSTVTGYLDASQVFTTTTTGTITRSFLRLALRGSTGEYLTADYNEILYYTRILPVSERQAVEGYLAWKWNLASFLQSNHPYKMFSP